MTRPHKPRRKPIESAEPAATPDTRAIVDKLVDRLFAPTDIASIVYFRILFGGLLLFEVYRDYENDWIRQYWIEPGIHFTYFGFDWVKPWPGPGMYVHCMLMALLAICIIVGFKYRLAAALMFLALSYTFLIEEARYLNHMYLICLISALMAVIPAHRAFSVDAWQKPGIRSNTLPAWNLWLLRFQIGIPYFFGGIAKINADWMRGEPLRQWLASRSHFPVVGPYFLKDETVQLFTWGGLFLDLLIVPLLLWRRTRIFAVFMGVSFHLMNNWIFSIGVFPWLMIAATLLFFPPDWPRRLLVRALPDTRPKAPESVTPPRQARLVVAGLLVFASFQILMPLRHLLYPGDVAWTEEGHRFSWRMKLRTKYGEVEFVVSDPSAGYKEVIRPSDFLPWWQYRKIACRPDMILELSHILAGFYFKENGRRPEVRAVTLCALNDHPPAPLIDPDVDLAATKRSLKPARWILPRPKTSNSPRKPESREDAAWEDASSD